MAHALSSTLFCSVLALRFSYPSDRFSALEAFCWTGTGRDRGNLFPNGAPLARQLIDDERSSKLERAAIHRTVTGGRMIAICEANGGTLPARVSKARPEICSIPVGRGLLLNW